MKKSRLLTGLFLGMFLCIIMSLRVQASSTTIDVTMDGSTWNTITMTSNDDVLWFRITLPSDGKLDITLRTMRKATNFGFYDADKVQMWKAGSVHFDGSVDNPGSASYSLYLEKGVYYVMAEDNMAAPPYGGDGDVQVKALFTSAENNEVQPNNSFSKAMLLVSGETVKGMRADPSTSGKKSEDFYKINVSAATKVSVKLISMMSATKLEIYSSDYSEVDVVKMGDGTEDSPISREWQKDLAAGTYYIKVTDDWYGTGAGGLYMISWSDSHEHNWNNGVVTTEATCVQNGIKTYTCSICGATKTEVIPADGNHQFGSWKITKKATVLRTGTKKRTCSICGETETGVIKKLKPTITLNVKARSVKILKKNQRFTVKVSGLAYGDKVVSWTSSNKKIAVVNKKGVIKGLKKGTAKITVKLKSGKEVWFKVKVKG